MAENSLSLSNLEGVQPSISQENKKVTNDKTQSNIEGDLVNVIQDSRKKFDGNIKCCKRSCKQS